MNKKNKSGLKAKTRAIRFCQYKKGGNKLYNLGDFRKLTEGLPDDCEIRIEACFTPEQTKSAAVFEIITAQKPKPVVLLMPQEVYISDGKIALHSKHGEPAAEKD